MQYIMVVWQFTDTPSVMRQKEEDVAELAHMATRDNFFFVDISPAKLFEDSETA